MQENKSRLKWACRRGMLELDVLLAPFVDDGYDELNEQQKQTFVRLLACSDLELFSWFMGRGECHDEDLAAMVYVILQRVKV